MRLGGMVSTPAALRVWWPWSWDPQGTYVSDRFCHWKHLDASYDYSELVIPIGADGGLQRAGYISDVPPGLLVVCEWYMCMVVCINVWFGGICISSF